MKKNYEKNEILITAIFIFIVSELIVSLAFYSRCYRTFKTINGIVVTNNYIKTYVDDKMLENLIKSKCFYLENKRINYKIINIERKVMRQNDTWYHEVLIRFNIPKKYKDNDSMTISIYGEKEKIYNIFIKCWESDL